MVENLNGFFPGTWSSRSVDGKHQRVKTEMSRSVVLPVVLVVVLLSHVVVGELNYISGKLGWMNRDEAYSKQMVQQNYGNDFIMKSNHKFGKVRDKRTANGPVASTPFIFNDDHHHYATVHYSGDESDVIFVLTYDLGDGNHVSSSALYRSLNYGKTFSSEASKFPSWAELHPRYHISEDKKTIVFPDDTSRTIYVSHDEGGTYTHYSVSVDPKSLMFHPTKSDWVLGFDDTENKLKVSLNLGKNWTDVSSNVRGLRDYSWGVPGVDWEVGTTDTTKLSKLYYNTYDSSDTSDDYDVSLMVTHYPFGSSSTREFDSNLGLHDAFLIVDKYIFVQHTVNKDTLEVELLVSYNRQPFNVARIPFEDSHDNYYVGSYRSAQALVIVRHTSGVDNLYLSDETGTYYSLSLDNIVLDVQNGVDLELIDSMNGTFIANQYVNGGSTIRTVITFDNGAEWHLLQAPEVTKGGVETDCEIPLCSLHLQMYSTYFSRLGVYSRISAPGIIIAHGNYGQNLSQNVVDLYISRDGGLRWEQTLVSSWDIQIIDHGGLLVAAKDYHQVEETYIMYSCNEGLSWVNFTFTTTPTVIWGVVTEPGETTTELALFGSEDRSNPEWAVISINFTSVFERKCASSDYWDWAVSDGRIADRNCLLGESMVIERRKTEVCCLSGEQYERVVSITPCECAREDFECDWGYRDDDYNEGKCVVDVNFADEDHTDQPCTSGYRKIAGDTCIRGITSDLLNCTLPVNCSSKTTKPPINPDTTTTGSTHSGNTSPVKPTSSANTSPVKPTSSANANTGHESDDKDSNIVPLIVLAVLLIVFFIATIVLVTMVVCMRRRLSSIRRGGYHLAATQEQVTFRGTDDEDDDVALLRP